VNGDRRLVDDAIAVRRRAGVVSGLRGRARAGGAPAAATTPMATATATAMPGPTETAGGGGEEACDLCGIGLPDEHRHLLALVERRIVCSCETCWAMRSGEGDYRPTGNRTVWLPDLNVPDDRWASYQRPNGLAFFMESTVTACVVAMYPSPGGATESELHFDSWTRMRQLNPVLESLEPDIEGLIANRLSDPPAYVIAPIDRCYELTGTVKVHGEGISGGTAVQAAIDAFFARLAAHAVAA
jgi:hypothetical protein